MDEKTIVCIEDDPQVIEFIRLILKGRGFNLIGAVGGREGLETARQVRPDLVLLDLMMPEISGWEVLDVMRGDHQLRDIPVIVVSVMAKWLAARHGAHVLAVDDYVTKPFPIQRLVGSVCTVLGMACQEGEYALSDTG
jgi:two-component system response regulator VicR